MAEGPEVFVFDGSSEAEAALDLAERFSLSGMADPIVVASVHGTDLASAIEGVTPLQSPPPGADQAWASRLGSVAIEKGAGAIVAVGGGRCLDLGKLAAARAGLSVFAVPTQLSHDGICSPVAVAPDDDGRAQSVGAISPRVVYLSIPTLLGAPATSVIAGVGDL
ncbi:MAG: iron-containing alcohol dehydrogenase, partial [Actinomycetota bacterium]